MTMRLTAPLIGLFLLLQGVFWYSTHTVRPDMGIVPDVPGKATLDVLAFGDEEFLYRAMAFDLGNAGDTFGRFTALYRYDMKKLEAWFLLLDKYDHRSNLLATLASYYFSQTQHTPDVRYMVDYLYETSKDDVQNKWWWLTQAVYLSLHKLDDSELAVKVAAPLTNATDVPVWVRQMPAFVYEKRGEFDDAQKIMQGILDNVHDIPDSELRFMNYFIDERLHRLQELSTEEKGRLLPLLPSTPAQSQPAPGAPAAPAPAGANAPATGATPAPAAANAPATGATNATPPVTEAPAPGAPSTGSAAPEQHGAPPAGIPAPAAATPAP